MPSFTKQAIMDAFLRLLAHRPFRKITVRNIVDFGCFVDIGVHEDGLVHISRICDRFLKHPSEAVKVGDVVKVMVLDVDEKRHRISLTMKGVPKES